jgi:hypothetical protein
MGDVHGFYHDRIGGIIGVNSLVYAGFNGTEQAVLVVGLNFKAEEGGDQKAIQKYQDV